MSANADTTMPTTDWRTWTLTELAAGAVVAEDHVVFPGARPPDRRRDVISDGVRIAVHEWGNAEAPPLMLVHGGFDFARTFDVFGPLLAGGGWRVVTWDHRNHGDSELAALNSWSADVRDAAAVINSTTPGTVPIVGHSKGGALALRLAEAWPHRFSHVVNIDGLPSRRPMPDIAATERTRMAGRDIASWLDHRASAAEAVRKPGTLDELARRRARMNPRLAHEWLCYLVTVGGRKDVDGWRWKIDPMMRMGGFGPFRSDWAMQGLPGLPMRFLGLMGSEQEAMGWDTDPEDLRSSLPPDGVLEVVPGVGHFIHIEQPGRIATRVLEFLK